MALEVPQPCWFTMIPGVPEAGPGRVRGTGAGTLQVSGRVCKGWLDRVSTGQGSALGNQPGRELVAGPGTRSHLGGQGLGLLPAMHLLAGEDTELGGWR